MSQIFLFTGLNEYELLQERGRWIREFIDKHGEQNLSVIPGPKATFHSILDEVSAAPFIAQKRLVVLDGLPNIDKEELREIAATVHPQMLVLVVEPNPDKRLGVTKEILSIAQVKTFAPLQGNALVSWAVALAKECGASLSTEVAKHLFTIVGHDQMFLSSEIRKLSTATFGSEITKESIENLTLLSEERASWLLMDFIAARKVNEAMQFARIAMEKGESPHALWSRLLWIVSQVTLVTSACNDGLSSPAAISKSTGVPFPTARSLQPFARALDIKRLKRIVGEYTLTDKELKTGGYRSTAEAPEELLMLIDNSIASLCAL